MTPKDFQIGQIVWVENISHRYNDEKTISPHAVTKIGRQYVTFGEGWQKEQFDTSNMTVKHDFGVVRCVWLSEQQFNEAKETERLWREFRRKTEFNAPSFLTPEKVRQIAEICGITLSEV